MFQENEQGSRGTGGQTSTGAAGSPRWVGLAVVILAVLSVAGLAVGWMAFSHARSAEQGLQTQAMLKQDGQVLSERLAKTEEANAQAQGELNVITSRLKLTQGELARARKQAKLIREDYNNQINQLQANVNTELATKASTDDVKAVSTDVQGVKTDLEGTKQNFQMARGELGTLIARNHDEIEQLRRLGERDYYEFTIVGKGRRQKVGDLQLELRGTNTNKHLFSVALFVDDLRFDKKGRSLNEPIYFYTRGSRTPLELVVNQVGKNKIVGYISVPKVSGQPTSASSSGN